MASPRPIAARFGRRRRLLVAGVGAISLALAGSATAWAFNGSGDSGYRMTTVVRTTVGRNLDIVGTVQPVADASPSFQVTGQVATVDVTAGGSVTAGETLASLDPTALSESLSSAQSSLEADTAKLTEDENAQTSTATPTPSQGASTTPTTSTQGTTSASSTQVVKDQTALVSDQTKASNDQAQEAADLDQAQSTCATQTTTPTTTTTTPSTLPDSTPSTTPTSTNSCLTAMTLVANDQQRVESDESVVATDESNLAKALSAASATAPASNPSSNGSSGTGASSGGNTSSTSVAGSSGNSQNGTSSASDSASQIDADQAAIDVANANVTKAQQAVGEATLTSPIAGTVTSVGITSGESVSAGSSAETITIVATGGYEVTGTLSTTQVPAVKVGDTAEVAVDGSSASLSGTLSQVGPVQTSSTGYSYPFVVALPASAHALNDGSTATVSLNAGEAKNVLAVPTSAVITQGTQSYVLLVSAGTTKERKIQTGIAGDIYTQVVTGLQQGESIVLADYADAVPSSNTTTTGGFGGAGGTGGGFGGRAPATGVGGG